MKRRAALALVLLMSAVTGAAPAWEWRTGGTGTAHWAEESGRLVHQGHATFGWAVRPGVSLADGFEALEFGPSPTGGT